MRHTISILVENKFGVLARVSGLFSSRGFNIESLSVGETTESSVSRMTIVTRGDDQIIEQVIKQLRRLIDVIKVTDLSEETYVERELVLIKVNADSKTRTEVMEIVDIFRGKIIDVSPKSYVIEVTGNNEKIDAIIGLLKPIGIKEIARTGIVAMSRGIKKEK
ncbi:MAG: acetolactate synthase small subunit [Candidatus Schekmanbacteria bacterium RBG_16_38_10]|uniref:Acetolactate synthase small subunit n=1 Tax=Candidatus Schekmanbacteria bacterium RBG_16_38_10 TaxID=1817879 RepID=A0A1F7RUG6_9BACT|nr:MAG: acetolactate synthase small subunit [Candidatus Schekmanbacteria bacterium RBG_16_38_10]